MRLKETAFVAKNIGGKRPYFAIATVGWTAGMARDDLMRGLEQTWPQMYRKGWRIVKVTMSECR